MIQLSRPHQNLRRPRPVRPRHVADHGPRARRPVRARTAPARPRCCEMMAGLDEPDSGAILKPAALTVGYLPQDGLTHAGRTVFDEASSAFGELLAMKAEMHALEERLGDPVDPGSRARRDAAPLQRPAGSLPPARRLQHRAEDGDRAAGPRLQDRGLRAADRDVLRRLADAHRAREAAARPAEPAAARRADQPPRPRSAQLARGIPERLSARGHPRLARPLLPRRGRHAHRRPDAAHAHRLPHQLQRLPRRAPRAHRGAAQGQARAGRRGRARQDVHRPLPLPGDQGVAGAEPHQDAREGRADRGAARAQEDPLRLPGLRQERPHGARAEARAQGLRRPRRLRRISTCTSSAATASRSSAPTAPASRR